MPPLSKEEAAALVKRRHPEWAEHQKNWRRLLDALEGGERYRHADYFRGPFDPQPTSPWYAFGFDNATAEGYPFAFNQIVDRNLVPHLSEMSVQGRDLYALRLNRTPVPALVEFVCRRYLSRIFARQVVRIGPPALADWWLDVDGRGTAIGPWMRKTIGPLLLVLGHIDLVFGRPEAPEGAVIETRADLMAHGLDGCVASFVLPENMVWWRLDRKGRYAEALVFERSDGGDRYRHWTQDGAWCYAESGATVEGSSFEHSFGVCPIVRVFDDKKLRCEHIGKPRLEYASEVMRSVYNRLSELVLSDVQQSHSILQGPEDYAQNSGKLTLGPGGMLPMKKHDAGDGYQGFSFIDTPKTGQESCRTHIQDDLDSLLLHYALLKPAGMTDGKTVGQSGVSKGFDARDGNDLLSEVSRTLQEAERTAAEFVLLVLSDGRSKASDLSSVKVEYPREYDLFSAEDLTAVLADVQAIVTASGGLPNVEAEVLKRLITVLLPGLDEDRLGELHAEIDDAVDARATNRDGALEAAGDGASSTEDPALSLPLDSNQVIESLNAALAPEIV